MFIYLPTIGTKFTINRDWRFVLHSEYRNETLLQALELPKDCPNRHYRTGELMPDPWKWRDTYAVALPEGTRLDLDRIFIRKGMADFDSVSLFIDSSPDQRLLPDKKKRKGFGNGRVRFWVKLPDFNGLDIGEIVEP